MAKQTFTTGQVLTAAQMTSLQQTAMGGGSATTKTASYVLVAADAGTTVTMTSASATTITVNTSLFAAGDTVYIQNLGAGVSTITAGTATVNTSATLALAQYEGGQLYFVSTSAAIFLKGDGAAASTGKNFTLLNSGGTNLTGSASTTISGISGKDQIFIMIEDASSASAGSSISVQINAITANQRSLGKTDIINASNNVNIVGDSRTTITLGVMSSNAASAVNGVVNIFGCNSAGTKMYQYAGGASLGGGTAQENFVGGGRWDNAATVSSIVVVSSSGNFDGGTVRVYASA